MIQIVLVFLVGMAGLAIWSRFRRVPGKRAAPRLDGPVLCGRCGQMTSARAPCGCKGGGRPKG